MHTCIGFDRRRDMSCFFKLSFFSMPLCSTCFCITMQIALFVGWEGKEDKKEKTIFRSIVCCVQSSTDKLARPYESKRALSAYHKCFRCWIQTRPAKLDFSTVQSLCTRWFVELVAGSLSCKLSIVAESGRVYPSVSEVWRPATTEKQILPSANPPGVSSPL